MKEYRKPLLTILPCDDLVRASFVDYEDDGMWTDNY